MLECRLRKKTQAGRGLEFTPSMESVCFSVSLYHMFASKFIIFASAVCSLLKRRKHTCEQALLQNVSHSRGYVCISVARMGGEFGCGKGKPEHACLARTDALAHVAKRTSCGSQ